MQAIVYSLIFVFFLGLVFYVLKAMRIERVFEQGKIFEIRMAYIILSIVFSFLLTEFVWRIVELTKEAV